ncbi:MAG: purine-binding chemotaxis protein CheW [Desulfobulbaceae bacterium]|nr:purine-binding chemotaxis protein CheW [Desulfobulbaceae bacterium]
MIKKMRQEEAVVDVNVKTEKLVVFSLAGELFAFAGQHVKEILIPQEISFVPGSPDFLLGVMSVRGDIESVASLTCLLGVSPGRTSFRNRILLAEADEVRSGILVEKVEDVIDVPVDSIKPPLATINGPIALYLTGETEYRGRNVLVLDLPKMFKRFVANDQ